MKFSLAVVTSLLTASSVLSASIEERAPISVTFYDKTSGRGAFTSLNFPSGSCRNLPASWRNKVSSFSKPRGVSCTVWDANNCQGQKLTIDRGQALVCSLNRETDNDINSIKCQ